MPPEIKIYYQGRELGRRDFLKVGLIVAGGVLTSKFACEDYDWLFGLLNRENCVSGIGNTQKEISDRYGLRYVWGESVAKREDCLIKPSNVYEANIFGEILCAELSKYPPGYIQKTAVKTIETSRSITKISADEKMRGICVPGVINIAYEEMRGNQTEKYESAKGVHHELAHRIVLAEEFYPYVNRWQNACWSGADQFDADCFVDLYSMSGIMEDIPSTMAALMMRDTHLFVLNKLSELRNNPDAGRPYRVFLTKYNLSYQIFYQASGGAMDGNYWYNLLLNKVDRNYWFSAKSFQ